MDARETSSRLVEPVDRISEVLFGLIMAVTIVGSLSVAGAGRQEVRTVLAAALGCNLAWGLVDAVMYLVRTLTERNRALSTAKAVARADPEAGRAILSTALPDEFHRLVGADEIEAMRARLVALPLPARGRLGREDWLAAAGIFALVVLATFPVVLPFLFVREVGQAMAASQAITVAMLGLSGFALGRYAGHARPWRTGVLMAAGGVALIAVVRALGG